MCLIVWGRVGSKAVLYCLHFHIWHLLKTNWEGICWCSFFKIGQSNLDFTIVSPDHGKSAKHQVVLISQRPLGDHYFILTNCQLTTNFLSFCTFSIITRKNATRAFIIFLLVFMKPKHLFDLQFQPCKWFAQLKPFSRLVWPLECNKIGGGAGVVVY